MKTGQAIHLGYTQSYQTHTGARIHVWHVKRVNGVASEFLFEFEDHQDPTKNTFKIGGTASEHIPALATELYLADGQALVDSVILMLEMRSPNAFYHAEAHGCVCGTYCPSDKRKVYLKIEFVADETFTVGLKQLIAANQKRLAELTKEIDRRCDMTKNGQAYAVVASEMKTLILQERDLKHLVADAQKLLSDIEKEKV